MFQFSVSLYRKITLCFFGIFSKKFVLIDFENIEIMELIIVAFISGLFALLGAFFGAWLTRKTEYQKWIRQIRSVEFSEFIKQLESLRIKASDILYNCNFNEQEKDIQITELFIRLKPQENIIRLYLNKSDRKTFSRLKHELWSFYEPGIEQSVRMKKHKEMLHDIQAEFEKNIKG